jgi:hypothetical protein
MKNKLFFVVGQAFSVYSQPIVREGAAQFRQAVDNVVIPNVKAGQTFETYRRH